MIRLFSYLTLAFSCIALNVNGFGQTSSQVYRDSLLNELSKSIKDTNQVNLLCLISRAFTNVNHESGILYGKRALDLAEILNWKLGIAKSCHVLGNNYLKKSDYGSSVNYYFRAMKLYEELQDKKSVASILFGLGHLYISQNDEVKALEYYNKVLKIYEQLDDVSRMATVYIEIGTVYTVLSNFKEALDYTFRGLSLARSVGNEDRIAGSIGNLGGIYLEKSDYAMALKYCKLALPMFIKQENRDGTAYHYGNIGRCYLSIAIDSNKQVLNELFDGNRIAALKKAEVYTDSAILIQKELGALINLGYFHLQLSEIQSLLGKDRSALANHVIYANLKDSIISFESSKRFSEVLMQNDFDKKELMAKLEQEKKDIAQRNIRNSIAAGLVGALIFLMVVYRQRNRIAKEKKRSEELLLNILPPEVAQELMTTGETAAKNFNLVTVLFTDFKNFTQMSEMLSAQELVDEINYCYSAFDNITTKHGIEKIKTIGDAYMCAGGLPVTNTTNAIDTVSAALDIRDFMLRLAEKRKSEGKLFFEIRIGCNTGSVIAGIVGIKKFAYDIWGDTVNIAARMESACEPGKVNISGSTYELVKDRFTCEPRGKIEAKNKGMIDMYFVEC